MNDKDKQTTLGSSSEFWGDERTGQSRPSRRKSKKTSKKKSCLADAVRVETTSDPVDLAAIWPHVRPIAGLVVVGSAVLKSEIASLWSGPIGYVTAYDVDDVFPRLVVLREEYWDLNVIRRVDRALEATASVGGTVAALLPLAALRLHAEWMVDHPPDVYVLPSLYQGHTSGWFVWSPERGRGRLRFLRPVRV